MSVTILVIDKKGVMKSQNVKNLTQDTIYKKCGLRNSDGFHRRHVWYIHSLDADTVELWACDTVKSGQYNSYELPAPLDNKVYYGSMALISVKNDGTFSNLSLNTWAQIYETLLEDGSMHEDSQDNDSLTCPDTRIVTHEEGMHYDDDEPSVMNESSEDDDNSNLHGDVINEEDAEFMEALHGDGSELEEEEYEEY